MTGKGLKATCHDCGAHIGHTHLDGCGVARCLRSGQQRLSCPGGYAGFRDCGQETWTGLWPGVAECRSLGWFSYWQPPPPGKQHGRFIACPADYPDAREDLTRLRTDGHWNAEAAQWEPGPCAHRYTEHVVRGPRVQ
jgi:hypothetical protein